MSCCDEPFLMPWFFVRAHQCGLVCFLSVGEESNQLRPGPRQELFMAISGVAYVRISVHRRRSLHIYRGALLVRERYRPT